MARRFGNTHLLALAAAAILMLAACGGSDDASTDDEPSSDSDTAGDDSTDDADDGGGSGSDDAADDADDADAGDVIADAVEMADEMLGDSGGVGTVTIGDQTWELAVYEGNPIANCNSDFFGGFLAILASEGAITDPIDSLTLTLPGGDFTDPPGMRLKVQIGSEAEWIAEESFYERAPDLPPGLGITDFSIDGNTARGTATFFEEESWFQSRAGNGELVVADGTFEVTCAG